MELKPVGTPQFVDTVSVDVVGVLKNITAADFTLVYDTDALEKVSITNVSTAFTSSDGELVDEAVAGQIRFDGFSGTAVSSATEDGTLLYTVTFKIKETNTAHRLYIDPASDIFGMSPPDYYSQNVYAASLADITFDGRPLDPAPIATLTTITGDSNILNVTFDQPVFLNGTALELVPVTTETEKLAFLQTFFDDSTLTADMFNAENITIALTSQSVTITLGPDSINHDLFVALDNPETGTGDPWVGDGNGIYRIDVDVDATVFANRDDILSTSDLTPFKIKFSVPMENGVPQYEDPIAAIFQTQEQRDAETDPLPDTTAPIMQTVTPAEGLVVLEPTESFVLTVDAFDLNLYSLEIDHSFEGTLPEFSVYASEENPYGTEDDRTLFEETFGVHVTYDDVLQKWMIDFGPTVTAAIIDNGGITFYMVLHDYADNKWGSMDPTTDENTYVYIVVNPLTVTDADLLASADNPAGPYTLLGGDFTAGFTMVLDPAVTYYYLDVDNFVSNNTLKDGLYPFTIASHPATGFFEYWAAKGVMEGATGWQGQMWDIINGDAPLFYVKVDGSNYTLVDGLEYWSNPSTAGPAKINGSYFTGAYTFTGSLTDIYDTTDALTIGVTFTRAIAPTITGTVSMQARTFTGGVPVTLTGDFGYGPYTEESINRISDNLTFSNIGKGVYTITTLQPRYLNITAAMGRTIDTYSDTVITPLRLVGGNAYWNDNEINDTDLSMVRNGYKDGLDLYPNADVNYDDKVNVQDL